MRGTATGAVKRYGGASGGRTARNWNTLGSTAGAGAISSSSLTPNAGITRVQVSSTRHTDYLIMAGLIVFFIVVSRKG